MRRFGLCLALLLLQSSLALGEVPSRLHYQGHLTNAAGEAVDCPDTIQCDTSYNLTFRLYDDPSAEVSLWEETHVAVPIYQGLFQVLVGSKTLLNSDDVAGARYIGIAINAGSEMIPRQEIASAPFAFHASVAEAAEDSTHLGGVEATEYTPGPHTIDTTLSEAQVDGMVGNNGYAIQGDVDTSLASIQADLVSAQESLNNLQTSLASLETTVSEQGASQGDLQSAITTLQNNIDAVQTNLTALDTSLDPIAKTGLPADLADGDDNTDALAALVCTEGQIPKRVGETWACADDEGGAVGTVEPVPCDASAVGQMYFDEASNALRLCDGTEYRKIKLCTEVCPPASAVVCGLPVEDDCGSACGGLGTALNSGQCTSASTVACGVATTDDCDNACVESGTALNPDQCNAPTTACGTPMIDSCGNLCGGNGVACGPGLACTNDTCTPTSCKALLDLGLSTGNGNYTIDVDGTDPIPPFQVECDMTTDGGGWTLVAIISSHDGLGATDCTLNWDREDDRWTDGSVLNEGNFFTSLDHKYLSYSTMGFSEFLMKEQVASAHGWKAWDIGSQTNFAQMMQGGCTTLASTPTSSGGSISASNALIYANNLMRNCNCDYANGDDTCRLHGNSPNNPDGNCFNGGWGLGVDGDNHCNYNSEARPQRGGWSNQCYPQHRYYTNGNVWTGPGVDHGHFVGHLYVR